MRRGVGAAIYGPTPSQLGIETVSGPLTQQIQGATPDVQNYISQLEQWINASGSAGSSQGLTTWLNTNAKTLAIVAAVGVGALLLMKAGR